jgi:hypothetical protein
MAVIARTHASIGTATAVQIAGVGSGGPSGPCHVYINPAADILIGGTSVAADCDFPLTGTTADATAAVPVHHFELGTYEEIWALAATGTTTVYVLETGR